MDVTDPTWKVMIDLNPVHEEYTAWRVVSYKPDGTYTFVPTSGNGPDFKTQKNAESTAKMMNARYPRCKTVVKQVKVKVEEV